jgi:acetoacetate decarboxylase
MGFVRTPEEVERLAKTLRDKRLAGERLSVWFLTSPETVARVLPPGLEPGATPQAMCRISRWSTSYCGAFTMATVYVSARYGDLEGDYYLAMYIDSSDAALLIGREEIGEPKKMASVELFRNRDSYFGTVERHGVRLIELRLDPTRDLGPSVGQGVGFCVKATLAVDGNGLDGDAKLCRSDSVDDRWLNLEGTGHVALSSSAHDPLDELEVREVVRAAYAQGEIRVTGRSVLTEIPGDAFLPYHYGRLDDWTAHGVTERARRP